MPKNNDDRPVTFEIVEEIGVISTSGTGWQKELNIVAWNGNQGKYDIREWSPHHDRMSRGITLNEQEMRAIVELLKRRVRYVPRGKVTISQEPEGDVQDEAGSAPRDEAGPAPRDNAWSAQQAAEGQSTADAAGPAAQSADDLTPQVSDDLTPQEDSTFIPRAMEEAPQQEAAF